jgi:hypothetical protein
VTAVTTAGLLAGLFGSAFVPAARAAWTDSELFSCTTALDSDACSTIPDGRITISTRAFDVTQDWTSALNDITAASRVYIQVSGATIVEVVAGEDAGEDQMFEYGQTLLTDGQNWPEDVTSADLNGYVEFIAAAADHATDQSITVERSTAGTATVTIFWYDGGVKTTAETFTLTWAAVIDGNAVDFGNDDTLVGVGTLADCEAGFESSDIDSSVSYDSGDNSDAFYICVQLYTEDGGLVPAAQKANVDVEVTDPKGLLNIGNDGSSFSGTVDSMDADSAGATDNLATADDGIFAVFVESEDDDVESFNTTVSVEITHEDDDLGIDVTKTYSIAVKGTGDIVTLTLVTTAYSLGDAANDDAIEFYGKDAAGNLVEVNLTDDNEMVIDSDISSAATIDDAGEEDATAALSITADATFARYISGTAGEIYGEIAVDCGNADTDKESFTVKLVMDSAATGDEEVVSNTVTIYCALDESDSMTFVSYTKVGGTATAKVRLLDALGYPVPDGTDVTAITSAGVFAVGAGTDGAEETENGVAEFTHLVTGTGIAVMIFSEGANTSLTKSVSYGGAASLSKLNATSVVAAFGADAAGETITFTIEKVATGKVLTVTRVANANGRATYTLGAKRSGRWIVTATYGDEISNSRFVRR